MDDSLQNITDALITHIDKAIAKGSVTNQQVAAVLDFLNERVKRIDDGKYIRKDQPDSTDFLLRANGGLIVRSDANKELSSDLAESVKENPENKSVMIYCCPLKLKRA